MGRSEFLIPDRMPLGDGSLNGKAAFIAGVEVTLFPDGWPSGNRSTTIESGREAMSSEVFWDGSPVVRTIGFQPNSRRCRQNRSDRCTPGVIFGGNSVRIKRQLRKLCIQKRMWLECTVFVLVIEKHLLQANNGPSGNMVIKTSGA